MQTSWLLDKRSVLLTFANAICIWCFTEAPVLMYYNRTSTYAWICGKIIWQCCWVFLKCTEVTVTLLNLFFQIGLLSPNHNLKYKCSNIYFSCIIKWRTQDAMKTVELEILSLKWAFPDGWGRVVTLNL